MMGYSSKARGPLCTRKAEESKCTSQAKPSKTKQSKAKKSKRSVKQQENGQLN